MSKAKHVAKPNSNRCHFCGKCYSATMEDIFETGKLFQINDYLVGVTWYSNVVVCPTCIKEQVEKVRAEQDAMLAEVASRRTNRKLDRYYPPKRTKLKVCPSCNHKADPNYLSGEECGWCGYNLVKMVDDPRQVRKRERRKAKQKYLTTH